MPGMIFGEFNIPSNDQKSLVLESLVKSGITLSDKSLEFYSYLVSNNLLPNVNEENYDSLIFELYNNFINS
jgi:hypothetical protein